MDTTGIISRRKKMFWINQILVLFLIYFHFPFLVVALSVRYDVYISVRVPCLYKWQHTGRNVRNLGNSRYTFSAPFKFLAFMSNYTAMAKSADRKHPRTVLSGYCLSNPLLWHASHREHASVSSALNWSNSWCRNFCWNNKTLEQY